MKSINKNAKIISPSSLIINALSEFGKLDNNLLFNLRSYSLNDVIHKLFDGAFKSDIESLIEALNNCSIIDIENKVKLLQSYTKKKSVVIILFTEILSKIDIKNIIWMLQEIKIKCILHFSYNQSHYEDLFLGFDEHDSKSCILIA